jgi:tetratricopeptide (TPR) repeat protein
MILLTQEERKKEAFRLFEDGRYTESLRQCDAFLSTGRDPAIEVLAATNLYSGGRLDDAEAAFRDLAQKMPDSSYVHSYLAKVLEAGGDEGAAAEYAIAVHLDPGNQDALRSFANYQLSRRDYRSALPVLRRLVHLGKRRDDVKNLMRVQIELGQPGEALATAAENGEDHSRSPEYVDALVRAGRYAEAAQLAEGIYRETKDPAILRIYLRALAQCDPPASIRAYTAHIGESPDSDIILDYILMQKSAGNYREALEAVGTLLLHARKPEYRLLECDLLASSGDTGKALVSYERLIRDELVVKNDMETLGRIIGRYRVFLSTSLPADDAEKRFLGLVSGDVNVASLVETARFFEDRDNAGEARAWYYRAYRADFLAGGLEYARFLSLHDEERDCEKVMLYVLSNVKKSGDLTKVAAVVVSETGKMHRLRRLMEQLIHRLEERRSTLGSEGLELLARSFFIAAVSALEEMDYAACKYYCLSGMDVMPTHTEAIHLGDFLQLVLSCKERSVADSPIMHTRPVKQRASPVSPVAAIASQLELSEQEQAIVTFLQKHRTATELELRKLLGTRRIVGLVNRLARKADSQGVSLIHKKGVGEDGEVYEYTGT